LSSTPIDRQPPPVALLPPATLALDLGSRLHVVALTLLGPQLTLRALPSEALQAAALFPRAVAKRRAEFAAGRHAAGLALAQLGCLDAVSRNADGSPGWPTDFTGSISHGAQIAVAVGARRVDYAGVGIDVESLISAAQCAEIAPRILSSEELQLLRRALPNRGVPEHLSLGFSAKESLYKCLNPLVARFIEFEDARVARVLPESESRGRIWLALRQSLSSDFPSAVELPGRYAFASGRIETAVWLTAPLA